MRQVYHIELFVDDRGKLHTRLVPLTQCEVGYRLKAGEAYVVDGAKPFQVLEDWQGVL
jgi:hypothetical protein